VVVADILEDGAAETERDLNALGAQSMGAACEPIPTQ
jgi:hypothetical protein